MFRIFSEYLRNTYFKSYYCLLFYWKPQLSPPKCSLFCICDCIQLHRMIFRYYLLLSQFFRWQNETSGKWHDLLKVIHLISSWSHAMEFRVSISHSASWSKFKDKVRIFFWMKSALLILFLLQFPTSTVYFYLSVQRNAEQQLWLRYLDSRN